jgi:hypothetical protein
MLVEFQRTGRSDHGNTGRCTCPTQQVCRLIRRLSMRSPGFWTVAQAVDIGGSRSQPHRKLGIVQQGRDGPWSPVTGENCSTPSLLLRARRAFIVESRFHLIANAFGLALCKKIDGLNARRVRAIFARVFDRADGKSKRSKHQSAPVTTPIFSKADGLCRVRDISCSAP